MKRRRCNVPSLSNSKNGVEEYSESIPLDLVIEILTRLPAKSVARFRSVSKLWDSTIRSPVFAESFFTISSSHPKLMFTYLKDDKTFFFTSPQPQTSSPLAANLQISFPLEYPTHICRPVRGLVCGLSRQTLKGTEVHVLSICNPSTGKFLNIPILESTYVIKICLGYEPVNKQFKVLCIGTTYDPYAHTYSQKYQVLTLGTGEKMSWKTIECDIPHYPTTGDDYNVYDEICINGVCCYVAWMDTDEGCHVLGIVCFDIRSKKFKFIRQDQGMSIWLGQFPITLVNYKGKLGKIQMNIVGGIYTGFQMWVLQNAEKHEWLNCVYDFPLLDPHGIIIVEGTKLLCVGMTATGAIVLSTKNDESGSFGLLYYNTESNTIKRVEIQGMEAYSDCKAYTFLDHVEDVKFM